MALPPQRQVDVTSICVTAQYTLTIPSNKEYSVPQVRMLLNEVAKALGRKVTIQEWLSL